MDFYSPLRYPGGKGKVADYFKQLFKDNLLYDGTYIEPYAGGSSVALSLLFNQYASKVIINDIDISIFSFWHSVLNQTDELCRRILQTPVDVANWEIQKQIQRDRDNYDFLDIGFSTFFLNRANRSGIIKAGIIGGKDQSGIWKIDARFNKKDLINRIQRIAYHKGDIELFNLDAVALVNSLKDSLPEKSLFYFDPPYYVKGKDLYLNYYKHQDHKQIAEAIGLITSQKWVVSYDNVDPIKNLYSPYRQVQYSLNYSAGATTSGDEVMIYSDNLFISSEPILKSTGKHQLKIT